VLFKMRATDPTHDWPRSAQGIQLISIKDRGQSLRRANQAPFMLISIVSPSNTALSDLIRTLTRTGPAGIGAVRVQSFLVT